MLLHFSVGFSRGGSVIKGAAPSSFYFLVVLRTDGCDLSQRSKDQLRQEFARVDDLSRRVGNIHLWFQ